MSNPVEPRHRMYLNNWNNFGDNRKLPVEPRHRMYLNLSFTLTPLTHA